MHDEIARTISCLHSHPASAAIAVLQEGQQRPPPLLELVRYALASDLDQQRSTLWLVVIQLAHLWLSGRALKGKFA